MSHQECLRHNDGICSNKDKAHSRITHIALIRVLHEETVSCVCIRIEHGVHDIEHGVHDTCRNVTLSESDCASDKQSAPRPIRPSAYDGVVFVGMSRASIGVRCRMGRAWLHRLIIHTCILWGFYLHTKARHNSRLNEQISRDGVHSVTRASVAKVFC